MFFYIFIYLSLCSILLFTQNKKNISAKVAVSILAIIYGFRNIGGIDDIGYIYIFDLANHYENIGQYTSIEKSYIYLSKIASFFNLNYKSIFLFYSCLSFIFLYLSFRHFCKDRFDWLIVITTFIAISFFTNLSLMRQFLASTIILYSIVLQKNNKLKRSIIFIFVAFIFHNSSIICLILNILFSKRFKIRDIYKIAVPLVALFMGMTNIIPFLMGKITFIIPSKYLVYIDQSSFGSGGVGLLHYLLLAIYIFGIYFKKISKSYKEVDSLDFIERGIMLYLTLYFITISSGWSSRISILYLPFTSFMFFPFLKSLFQKDKFLFSFLLSSLLLTLFFYQLLSLPSDMAIYLFPYRFSIDFIGSISDF